MVLTVFYMNNSIYDKIQSHFKVFSSESTNRKVFNSIVFFVGIIAGWGQENVAFLGAAFLFLYLLENIKQIKIIPWYGIVGFAFGVILLFTAPGNFKRAGSAGLHIDISKITTLLSFNFELCLLATICFIVVLVISKKIA
ncbi:DUF6056 family protein [Paenibacillus sp. WLX2291]|uniref:DUF6056 family protein n=1 Tax=Paenibacillus sp. WLX2291 TaxID=3296934 RepID=UPI0039844F1B